MSLKQPTSREYIIVGIVNVAVALVLGLRGSWTAAYFGLIGAVAFGCAIRAASSRRAIR